MRGRALMTATLWALIAGGQLGEQFRLVTAGIFVVGVFVLLGFAFKLTSLLDSQPGMTRWESIYLAQNLFLWYVLIPDRNESWPAKTLFAINLTGGAVALALVAR